MRRGAAVVLGCFLRRGGAARAGASRLQPLGVLRVLVYATAVSSLVTAITLRNVYGHARDYAFSMGRDLLALEGHMGPAQPIVINGTTMFVGATHVDLSIAQLFDRIEVHCQERSGNFAADFAKLDEPSRLRLPASLRNPARWGTVRQEVEDEGFLACIAAPDGANGLVGFVERAESFLETGDMAALGRLRYVFAKGNAKAGGTNIVTVWQEGAFNVVDMLLSEGDVRGKDLDGLPRPAGSVRVLAADLPGTGYGVRAYRALGSPRALVSAYEQTMKARGWSLAPVTIDTERAMSDATSRAYIREGAVVFVMADEEGEHTDLQLVYMGAHPSLQVRASQPLFAR